MAQKFVSKYTTPLLTSAGKVIKQLLWGDHVFAPSFSGSGLVKVRARGTPGWVDVADLGDESLLEVYFIDVGQGDGVLIRTPDGRHLLMDAGYKRAAQPTGKNAADFVDWKFVKDYGDTTVRLDALIASHCDADHYGGLWDLLNPEETHQLDATRVEVGTFYHAGVGWWSDNGTRNLGPIEGGYLTRLIEDRDYVKEWVTGSGGVKLQGEWSKFLQTVLAANCPIQRISHTDDYLPGFGPDPSGVAIKVLAPVEYERNGKPALKSFGDASQNTNGNSAVLRLDYGHARILMTGDLNKNSQQAILAAYADELEELRADVIKGCHHGSDDCSYSFLQAVNAACTVISSGDSEGHAHPRPTIVAASGQTGYTVFADDKIVTPLVYSTEISRSYRVGFPTRVLNDGVEVPLDDLRIEYREITAGALQPRNGEDALLDLLVVPGIVYGLVNVRTDGETILCATMNETKGTWDLKTFPPRF